MRGRLRILKYFFLNQAVILYAKRDKGNKFPNFITLRAPKSIFRVEEYQHNSIEKSFFLRRGDACIL